MSGQKLLKMYNLNVNVATTLPVSFLALDGQGATPRTPEIVNSLVAMTNPFDALMKPAGGQNSPGSEESCSGTASPLGSPTSSPPSVQHTRSQLIKEGLKLTIQSKRKHSGSETKEEMEEFESKRTKRDELTEEDEERRKRRRERNKIAATKCRMKKREKTANLVNESEQLANQNIDLKTQIQHLQKEKRNLLEMLSMHTATCVKYNSANIQSQTFGDFVGVADPYGTFDDQAGFGSGSPVDFEIGSTNGTPMNPYGKDPNFAKLLDEVATTTATSSANFDSRSFAPNEFHDSVTNFYQTKNRTLGDCGSKSETRSSFDYQSDKKSGKYKEGPGRGGQKKVSGFVEEDAVDVFRANFRCSNDDDSDTYKPNGIIDGNFFTNRTDNLFFTSSDHVTNFGNTPLDNGCMA